MCDDQAANENEDDAASGNDDNAAGENDQNAAGATGGNEYVGEYDKLVRDDIPGVVRDDGNHPVTRRVDGREFDRYLAAKLVEEATEYAEALEDDDEDPMGELADVHAVLDAIVDARDASMADVRDRAQEKARDRGAFADGIVLERIEDATDASSTSTSQE